jgi:hypothetical protein
MPDHAEFSIMVEIPDMWALPYEEPERWSKTKEEATEAVRQVMIKNGFTETPYVEGSIYISVHGN